MRTGRQLSKKETCPRLLDGNGGGGWGTNSDECSRYCDWIGSVNVPIKTVQLHEQIQIQQGKIITRRQQPTSVKWRRNKTVWFPARLRLRPSTSSFVTQKRICNQFTQTFTAPLTMFHMTERRRFKNEASVINTLSGDHVWSYVHDESTVWWGLFTNHKYSSMYR